MSTLYKAVRPDGTDFYTGTVQWTPVDGVYPHHVQHPDSDKIKFSVGRLPNYSTCLSLSSEKTDCIGFEWPARLLAVEAPDATHTSRNKYACLSATVVAELPAYEVFGPQGEHVVRLLAALEKMTPEQVNIAARTGDYDGYRDIDAVLNTALGASRSAALGAVEDATCDAVSGPFQHAEDATIVVWAAVRDAVAALIFRDLVSRERYDAATRTLRLAGFTIHPDDMMLA